MLKSSMAETCYNLSALYFNKRLLSSLALMPGFPLTVLEAPMGYGKTSAIREYLRANALPAIWVQLNGPEPGVFWRNLCYEMERRLPPSARDTIDRLQRLGYPYDSVLINEARVLLSQLDFNRPIFLIIDDYHWLPDQNFARLCEIMAANPVANLRIVLITRDAYQGGREILSLKSGMHFIGRNILALNTEDIQKYYQACGIDINRQEAEYLQQQTMGWISALYLYALHYAKHNQLARPDNINALLDKEVYAPLSGPLKQLLFHLCPLHSFNARQAIFLGKNLGNAVQVEELLSELVSKNSFTLYNETSQTYTLHNIFRNFLQERFNALPAGEQHGINIANGDWFMLEGQTLEALDIYYQAGEFEKALAALESDMSRNMVTEKAHYFVEFFQSCPQRILERHMAAGFKYALAAFSSANYPLAVQQCAALARQCEQFAPDNPQGNAWRGELEFLHSLLAYNDIAKMSEHHRKANALLGQPTRLFGEKASWTLGSPSVLFMFHRGKGQLKHEIQLMFQCMPHYYQLAAGHGSGGEYLMQAEALYYAGKFQRAEIAAHKAEAFAGQHGQLGNVLCALFLRMRLAMAAGDYTNASGLLSHMEQLVQESKDYFLLHTVEMCAGWLYGCLGQARLMPAWLLDQKLSRRLYAFADGVYYIINGQGLLLAGRYTQVLGLFAWLMESGRFAQHLLFTLYAHIYQATAHHRLGHKQQAGESLALALELALADQLYMPLVENYDFISPLLGPLEAEYPAIKTIHKLGHGWQKNITRIVNKQFGCKPLTKRELQLAGLASQGKKYAEIAAMLNLSPSTVKKAFSVMYQKLGLHSIQELKLYLAEKQASKE